MTRLKPLKDVLPPEITYDEIRLVVAHLRRQAGKERYSRGAGKLSFGKSFCRISSGAHAIRHSDPAISIPGQHQSRQALASAARCVPALQMAHSVLRHGGLPFVHSREYRFGAQSENLLQFVPNDGDDLIVGEMPDVLRISIPRRSSAGVRDRQERDAGTCCARRLRPADVCLRCAEQGIQIQEEASGRTS